MAATIRIELVYDPHGERIHQFRNFGEDVYRALSGLASVDIAEIDAAIDCFYIRDIRKQQLGTVTKILNRLTRKHGFHDLVSVQRTDLDGGSEPA